jgi:hypothetical protein
MATEKQIAADRANAQKGMGPKRRLDIRSPAATRSATACPSLAD